MRKLNYMDTAIGIKNFFVSIILFCSGASKECLKKSPESEYNKYIGFGIAILLTGAFASLSGGYAIHTIFQSKYISVPVGLLWGFMIINIDRALTSTMICVNEQWKNLVRAIPRLVLAAMIGIVVAHPIELRLFKSEIDNHLLSKYEAGKLNEKNITDKIKEHETELETLKNEKIQLKSELDALRQAMTYEAEGTVGTGRRGKGEVFELKKEIYEKANAESVKVIKDIDEKIEAIKTKIKPLKEELHHILTENVELKQYATNKSFSFLTQSIALFELSSNKSADNKSNSIKLIILFITCLFVVIEILPVIVKLMSSGGEHDSCINEGKRKAIQANRKTLKEEVKEWVIKQLKKSLLKAIKKNIKNTTNHIDTVIQSILKNSESMFRDSNRRGIFNLIKYLRDIIEAIFADDYGKKYDYDLIFLQNETTIREDYTNKIIFIKPSDTVKKIIFIDRNGERKDYSDTEHVDTIGSINKFLEEKQLRGNDDLSNLAPSARNEIIEVIIELLNYDENDANLYVKTYDYCLMFVTSMDEILPGYTKKIIFIKPANEVTNVIIIDSKGMQKVYNITNDANIISGINKLLNEKSIADNDYLSKLDKTSKDEIIKEIENLIEPNGYKIMGLTTYMILLISGVVISFITLLFTDNNKASSVASVIVSLLFPYTVNAIRKRKE